MYQNRHVRPTIAIAVVLLFNSTAVRAQTPQEHVHHMSANVMPFELSATVHIFRMTESGGVQQVVAKEPAAADQVTLIQQHLQHETEKFRHGDYSDPANLHGTAMPGLKELQAGASRINVDYAPLPSGAQITFDTTDLHLLTAIHRWFGAQLSEHGADARAE
ncbi:hypothetical protein [Marinobacterium sedimentorum]|uniref:hypothetical protein n=1 Tax=Marinobacterium sedimentorum TaxID=2927804 RepID=UPI0020C65B24|nr:hypothetical protein [Marinobacterium sedimentorum]MCP8690522.1 hypothetical protein [Marinobacterium sedimentorum]